MRNDPPKTILRIRIRAGRRTREFVYFAWILTGLGVLFGIVFAVQLSVCAERKPNATWAECLRGE